MELTDSPGKRILTGHVGAVTDLCFDPAGSRVASAGADGALRVWDSLRGELVALHGHVARVNSVLFAPGDAALISSSRDGTVHIWDAPAATRDEVSGQP